MQLELTPSYTVEPAQVAAGRLRQHEVRELEPGRALVMAMALSPPRLWAYLLDAALTAFAEGYERPHDGRESTRLHQGLRVAQLGLRTRIEALIERRMPDVALLGMALDDTVLHVVAAGPLRAYLYRRKLLRRLSAKEDSPAGMLKASSSWCAEQVEPGDLFFACSLSACSEPALDALQRALTGDRNFTANEVVGLLNGQAAANGLAAVSLAYRVPGSLRI